MAIWVVAFALLFALAVFTVVRLARSWRSARVETDGRLPPKL